MSSPTAKTRPLERILRGLSKFPHRGSTTEEERAAAQFLAQELNLQGFEPLEQRFESPKTYSWNVVGAAGLLTVGAIFGADVSEVSRLGIVLTVLGAWWLLAHFSLSKHFMDYFIPTAGSQNVLTRFGSGEKHLIIMAHYDTAKSAFLYHPARVKGFRLNFIINIALAVLTPIITILAQYVNDFAVVLYLFALFFGVTALIFFLRERNEPFVNGANDNASGVAAACELASRLWGQPNTRVTLLLTGCEEVGAVGAKAFLGTLEPSEFPHTLVLNLDNVGKGNLHFATGEGMLEYVPYAKEAVEIAREVARDNNLNNTVTELEYRLAYFDTLPFAKAGVPCLSLIALESGTPPHWHWPTDTLEHVEVACIEHAVDFAEQVAWRWLRTLQLN
jgi:hypothetical protein